MLPDELIEVALIACSDVAGSPSEDKPYLGHVQLLSDGVVSTNRSVVVSFTFPTGVDRRIFLTKKDIETGNVSTYPDEWVDSALDFRKVYPSDLTNFESVVLGVEDAKNEKLPTNIQILNKLNDAAMRKLCISRVFWHLVVSAAELYEAVVPAKFTIFWNDFGVIYRSDDGIFCAMIAPIRR